MFISYAHPAAHHGSEARMRRCDSRWMRLFVSFLLALSKLEQRMGSIVEADNLGEAFTTIVNAIGSFAIPTRTRTLPVETWCSCSRQPERRARR